MDREEFLENGKKIVAENEAKETAKNAELEAEEQARLLAENENKEEVDEGEEKKETSEEIPPVEETPEQKLEKSEANKKAWREIESNKAQEEKTKQALKEKEEEEAGDDFLKLYREAKKSGNIKAFLKAYSIADEIDIEAMDEKAFFMESIKNDGLDENEMESQYEAFMNQPNSIKKVVIEKKKEELKAIIDKNKESFVVKNKFKEHAPKAYEEIASLVDESVGTLWNEVDVTPAIAANVVADAKRLLFAFAKDDGTFDAKEAVELAKLKNMFSMVVGKYAENAASKAKVEQAKKFLSPDAYPDKNKGSGKGNTELEAGQKALAERQKSQIPNFKNN